MRMEDTEETTRERHIRLDRERRIRDRNLYLRSLTPSAAVGRFMRMRTKPDPMGGVAVADLYAAWVRWCADRELTPGNVARFSRALSPWIERREPAVRRVRWSSGVQVRGIALDEPGVSP